MSLDNEYLIGIDQDFKYLEREIQDKLEIIESKDEKLKNDITELINFINMKFDIASESRKHFRNLESTQIEYDKMKNELEDNIDKICEIINQLNFENKASDIILNLKKEERRKLRNEEMKKINEEMQTYANILNKEIDVSNQLLDDNHKNFDEDKLNEELNKMITLYKQFAHFDVERSKDGLLKIIFSHLNKENIDSYIKLEIKDNSYEIVETFPKIDCKNFLEMLKNNHNFSYVIAEIANSFIEYFNAN